MPSVFSKLPVMISDEDIIDKRYENCIIYKLVHKDDEDAYEKYVGHTIVGLKERMRNHIKDCNNENLRYYNIKVYQYIRETGGIDMWEMIKIIDYPCKNEIEAGKKEGEYIRSLNCSLNTKMAGRSFKEYYDDNKEYYIKYNKEMYKQNRDIILVKRKIIIKCDNCGCDIRKSDIARHKKTLKCINHITTP